MQRLCHVSAHKSLEMSNSQAERPSHSIAAHDRFHQKSNWLPSSHRTVHSSFTKYFLLRNDNSPKIRETKSPKVIITTCQDMIFSPTFQLSSGILTANELKLAFTAWVHQRSFVFKVMNMPPPTINQSINHCNRPRLKDEIEPPVRTRT